jgi:hypothetical protein
MSDRGASVCGGTFIMIYVARVSSCHGVVAMGAGGVPMLCLQKAGSLELPSPLEAM